MLSGLIDVNLKRMKSVSSLSQIYMMKADLRLAVCDTKNVNFRCTLSADFETSGIVFIHTTFSTTNPGVRSTKMKLFLGRGN